MQYKNVFLVSAGRPPLGQIPFLVTPEGKVIGQSGAIMKYVSRKGGKIFFLQNYPQYSRQMHGVTWMEY